MRVGFIGFGKFARVRYDCLVTLPGVELFGFFDVSPQNDAPADLVRATSVEELLAEIDAVVISVPPAYAPDYVIQALCASCHVFCEKPAAVSLAELEKIKPHIKGNCVFGYGFNHRQHPSVTKMKELIDSQFFGGVLWLRGRYGKEVDASYRDSWRCNAESNGGGILIDQGIHMVDLMSHLVGGFNGAHSVLSDRYLKIPNVEDNAFITLFNTETKISASLHSTITQWRYLFSLEVFCERGSIVLNGLRTKSGSYGEEILTVKPNASFEAESGVMEIRYPANVSWAKEMVAFISAARRGVAYPFAGYDDALQTTALLDEIYRNATWI